MKEGMKSDVIQYTFTSKYVLKHRYSHDTTTPRDTRLSRTYTTVLHPSNILEDLDYGMTAQAAVQSAILLLVMMHQG